MRVFFELNSYSDLKYIEDMIRETNTWPIPCVGSYKGDVNVSYMSIVKDRTDCVYQCIKTLAKEFNQESILIVDNVNNAWLHYLEDNSEVYIGKLTEVSKEEALQLESWTKISNRYYTTCIEG